VTDIRDQGRWPGRMPIMETMARKRPRTDFDVTETAVRAWIKQADLDAGTRTDRLTSDERAELAALRRENRRLREDVEILKRAAAFFASRRPGDRLPVHRGGEAEQLRGRPGECGPVLRTVEGLLVRPLCPRRRRPPGAPAASLERPSSSVGAGRGHAMATIASFRRGLPCEAPVDDQTRATR
jgi:hypothetical protein